MFDRYLQSGKPSWQRRALILASLILHGAVGLGALVWSVFHVEEIAPPALSLTFFSAPPPPPPPPAPAKKTPVEEKPKVTPQTPIDPKLIINKPVEKKSEGGEKGGVEGGEKGGVEGGVAGGTVGGTGKMVAGFTLTGQQLEHPDPRLPDWYKNQHPGENIKGMYKVCIGPEGKISHVSPMTSIPGMDTSIMDQIRKGWTYKPQPAPVCFASVLIFKIN